MQARPLCLVLPSHCIDVPLPVSLLTNPPVQTISIPIPRDVKFHDHGVSGYADKAHLSRFRTHLLFVQGLGETAFERQNQMIVFLLPSSTITFIQCRLRLFQGRQHLHNLFSGLDQKSPKQPN